MPVIDIEPVADTQPRRRAPDRFYLLHAWSTLIVGILTLARPLQVWLRPTAPSWFKDWLYWDLFNGTVCTVGGLFMLRRCMRSLFGRDRQRGPASDRALALYATAGLQEAEKR